MILIYNRPHNLDKSIPNLVNLDIIDEIIILHGHKDHKKIIKHPKVKNIDDWDNNDKYYTLRKFKNVKYCKNQTVLLLDDDLYPSKDLVLNLVKEFKKDKNNIYGNTKRLCNKDGYHTWPVVNKYNYILTNLVLSSRNVVENVFEKMKQNKEFYNLVLKQKGNCEDLLFNHEFIKLYNKTPVFVGGHVTNLDNKKGFSTTNRFHHYKIRREFCKSINK